MHGPALALEPERPSLAMLQEIGAEERKMSVDFLYKKIKNRQKKISSTGANVFKTRHSKVDRK